MQDGSIQGYIAKTDLSGNTMQSLLTGSFEPAQICGAPDGTVWILGKNLRPDDGQQHDSTVLRQFSFEKGVLHSFLPENTVAAPVNSEKKWFVPFGSYVRCGKNKVSVYLRFTNEYVEVNTVSFELKRWKLDEAVVSSERQPAWRLPKTKEFMQVSKQTGYPARNRSGDIDRATHTRSG